MLALKKRSSGADVGRPPEGASPLGGLIIQPPAFLLNIVKYYLY